MADGTLGYAGYGADRLTGAYPLGNGYRFYLPWLMRFAAPDDWSPLGRGGINPYAYCLGDPINRSDPDGHMALGLEEALKTEEESLAAREAARASTSEPTSSGRNPEPRSVAPRPPETHQSRRNSESVADMTQRTEPSASSSHASSSSGLSSVPSEPKPPEGYWRSEVSYGAHYEGSPQWEDDPGGWYMRRAGTLEGATPVPSEPPRYSDPANWEEPPEYPRYDGPPEDGDAPPAYEPYPSLARSRPRMLRR
ncbi:hypothetical protein CAL14_01525 [Bordetella genomosp. 9]|uniref:RHS repeat-associated core domain-containing protein n=1 Tax=Bordetella genomosp. 9 TaxID=1416803 RepID=UPI000A292AB2|nr:RHS repeat-associated core domain-containing protein [Bordetella genomosp. 9]ARP89137.1 hypothetical protein CAL14_01525 [Bordetella genomosp. 9]